jgi:hypothetical protein
MCLSGCEKDTHVAECKEGFEFGRKINNFFVCFSCWPNLQLRTVSLSFTFTFTYLVVCFQIGGKGNVGTNCYF